MSDEGSWLDEARGPYGEILPPSLVEWMRPVEILAALTKAGMQESNPDRAKIYLHQFLLRRAVAGELEDDVDAMLIHDAVVRNKELLSLRPLGLESWNTPSFAPVLQYLGGMGWRVGLSGRGRLDFIVTDDPAEALAEAQSTFSKWYDLEQAEIGIQ